MVIMHDTPALHEVKKVLIPTAALSIICGIGEPAIEALSSAIEHGRFSSFDPTVTAIIVALERASASHLARKKARQCQQPA